MTDMFKVWHIVLKSKLVSFGLYDAQEPSENSFSHIEIIFYTGGLLIQWPLKAIGCTEFYERRIRVRRASYRCIPHFSDFVFKRKTHHDFTIMYCFAFAYHVISQ
ncbi:hypothetical protein XENOCAPTIV_007869 [Xenoophorus captivus]|uniref:Uncharacterized protein n=1 Tax=Xenoophorus captivus TaxID=1517983 RepID=A0ABV0Q3P3_9TELE